MRQAEGHDFGFLKRGALVEEAVEVDVQGAACAFLEEDVFPVAIAEPEDVPDHGHDGAGARVLEARGEPGARLWEHFDEPFMEDGRELGEDFGGEDGDFAGVRTGFVEERAELRVDDNDIFLLVGPEEDISQGLEVVDPFDQAALFVERRYRIGLDVEPTFTGLGISLEGSVDHGIELHQALIFAKVVFGLAQEAIYTAVRAPDTDLAWALQ